VRVKLSIDSDFVGYVNVKPQDLDKVFNNSVDELYVDEDILSKIPNKELKDFVSLLVSKIRKGGTLVLTSKDFPSINYDFMYNKIDENVVSELLNGHSGFYSCHLMEKELRRHNFKIDKMSINNYYFVVRGIR
jgi:hypothetical protein